MAFTREQIEEIWSKGISVEGYDCRIIRKDACGAWILRSSYQETDSDYGWEVDHIYPQSLLKDRGIDDSQIDVLDNLRPLNWKNNRSKSSDYPTYKVVTVADGEKNVDCDKSFTVNREVQDILAKLYEVKQ